MATWLRWEYKREALCGKPKWPTISSATVTQPGPSRLMARSLAGLSCGVGTSIPCYMTAHDAATGKQLWRRESIAGPGDPEEHDATLG